MSGDWAGWGWEWSLFARCGCVCCVIWRSGLEVHSVTGHSNAPSVLDGPVWYCMWCDGVGRSTHLSFGCCRRLFHALFGSQQQQSRRWVVMSWAGACVPASGLVAPFNSFSLPSGCLLDRGFPDLRCRRMCVGSWMLFSCARSPLQLALLSCMLSGMSTHCCFCPVLGDG